MTPVQVRGAALDDTAAISALFRAGIPTWQRVDADGRVQDVSYEALTIYERWLHGGAWMSVETAAIHLSHLLRGAGIPVVAVRDGQVVAYAEAYHGVEPEPIGDHLHLAARVGREDEALIAYLVEQARTYHSARLTADCVAHDTESAGLYSRCGLRPLAHVQRYNLPARSGQGFYKAVEHLSANPAQIEGWYMPAGRLGSGRYQWETLWPRTWYAIPEIRDRRVHRLHFSASGQEALVCCQQWLYDARSADIFLWSPKPLTAQLLTALRDWSHREGYRTLVMVVNDETAKVLGAEAEPDGFHQDTYAVDV